MPRIFDPKVFQLGYVGLGCTDLERTTAHYQSILGLSETAKGHHKETYLSIGYEHHNVILKKTDQKSLLSLGYQLKPNIEIGNFVKELRDLGLRPETKSDSQPGIASLIEVEAVPGHVLQFYSHIDSPAPGFKEGGVAPLRLGHVAVISPEADKLRRFYEDFLGFWYTDEFEGIATFLTCNRDHHVINLVHVPESRVHHVAFQLKDSAAHPSACDKLTHAGTPTLWGPSRHTAGHNLASYHYDPERVVAPLWDGNETWLVVAVVVLWGAFPVAYATLFSAFYLPALVMVSGLILRGVAFEFRNKTERMRWIWDVSFAGGSFVAAFIQGLMVGALVEGLPISNRQYAGGEFGWLSPFPLLCGVGLLLGYTLLGACWLVRKCEDEVRDAAYRLIPALSIGLLVFLIVVFAYALVDHFRIMSRWLERPYLFVFPAIGIVAAIVLAASVRQRRDGPPYNMVVLIFATAFSTLAISFWPYMIPFSITINDAAAPRSSLAFMFWGEGLFVFPLMLVYTAVSYSVFRGKIGPAIEHY